MRQLDLFATFFETPSQDTSIAEEKGVSENGPDSIRPAAPSYSRNSLRRDSGAAIPSQSPADPAIDNPNQEPLPEELAPVNLSLFPTLFDLEPFTEPVSVEEPETLLSEAVAEPETTVAEVEILVENDVVENPVIDAGEEIVDTLTIPAAAQELTMPKKARGKAAKRSVVPELERNGEVIFDDGKISVKIKAKSPFPAPIAKVKKEKEKKTPQKRGRKSFKEIDAEVDLIVIPDDEVLFQKQYYPISEVARWFRVNTSLLRFWENEFDVLKPRKNRKGDRLFRPEDVKNLQLIYQLLRQRKYTIEGAKEYIKTNRKKADIQLHLTNTLQKFKSFLLDLKANLQ